MVRGVVRRDPKLPPSDHRQRRGQVCGAFEGDNRVRLLLLSPLLVDEVVVGVIILQ